MPSAPSDRVSNNGLTVAAYAGDGDVLLAFSLDDNVVKQNDLAGFAIQCTPPTGQPFYLQNRINFTQPVTSATAPQQHPWTSSQDAPFQKFHWVHFPSDVVPGDFKYKVTARYCQGSALVDGPSAEVTVQLVPAQNGNFELGLTRAYVSSQAYVSKFQNKDIRPQPKTLDYDTSSYQPQYEWLGFHARKMVFDLLKECVSDKSITVDMFAYDFDEPDILKMCESLGSRLRIFLDNAPLHVAPALEAQVHDRLVKSAGAANVKQGHFKRFAHDKIIIQKKNGKATKVLTGSANFSDSRSLCSGQQRDAVQRSRGCGPIRAGVRVGLQRYEWICEDAASQPVVLLPKTGRRCAELSSKLRAPSLSSGVYGNGCAGAAKCQVISHVRGDGTRRQRLCPSDAADGAPQRQGLLLRYDPVRCGLHGLRAGTARHFGPVCCSDQTGSASVRQGGHGRRGTGYP